ncbi:MAG: SDR family NAD(P)-dependent oxidoreductase [bacterium]
MSKLIGRKIVVSGAARGIGFAISNSCLEEGAEVILVDLSMKDLESAAERLAVYRDKIYLKECNVADETQVKALFDFVKNEIGGLDALVNNAGITRDNLFMRMSIDQWQSVIDVNLTGTYLMSRHGIGLIRKSSFGRIVNLSSVVAYGNPGQANYSASKAGVIGLTKTLALELARYNVTVNAIAPGFIETEMTRTLPEKAREEWLTKIPAGRAGQPLDVAETIVFLLSDAASYITGSVIYVDGGLGL